MRWRSLTEEEREAITHWRRATGESPREIPATASIRKSWNKRSGSYSGNNENFPINCLRNPRFEKEYKFGLADLMPASRNASASMTSHLDLGIFSDERREQERKSSAEGILKYRHTYNSGDAIAYLTAADHLDLTAVRRGDPQSNEYDTINGKFSAATGKNLTRPEIDRS
ncbi:hypothetical protein [Lentzea flava]|uniref:Uncharacterized protein n=1 Tax=Lentzea flava TaxID=103732 RepID=A0ABQ2V0L4_9PSEU|nr:hypothetical protein [Lentzea flava]GGU61325.1 hypothetical protein GCM10010178_62010 [Lentzea flava]